MKHDEKHFDGEILLSAGPARWQIINMDERNINTDPRLACYLQTASHLGYPRKHLGNLENSEYQVSYRGLFKTQRHLK